MTDHTTTADIITLRKRPLSGAERAKAYRARKAAAKSQATSCAKLRQVATVASPVTPAARSLSGPVPSHNRDIVPIVAPLCVPKPVTSRHAVTPVTTFGSNATAVTPVCDPKSVELKLAPRLLTVTSFALAMVGITMNGWFARSLGSSEIAGWLFLAIGVAADATALALPSCAASLWHARQRGAALSGWLVWFATFAFALTAGIGFASVNITDVTTSRAGRVTPAIEQAKASLADAMASRDRECVGGVGKNCRAREEAVTERRHILDAAMASIEHTADPQIEAASHIVAWVSAGWLRPSGNDFAMLRLVLLALLPQVGGILLMIGRRAK